MDVMLKCLQHCQTTLVGIFLRDIHFFQKTEWIDEIKINRSRIFPRLSEKNYS